MEPKILEAIPGANPSGENLRYEVIYGEIRARVRRARGETFSDPDDPDFQGVDADWRFVARACRDLLERRSKDLMIAAWLTEAQLALDGWAGLRDRLDSLRELTERFWETLYPEIEDGDVEARQRVFEWLDTHLAETVALASTFLLDSDTEDTRRQRNRDLDACMDSLAALEDLCRKKFGEVAPDFTELRKALLGKMPAESNLLFEIKNLTAADRKQISAVDVELWQRFHDATANIDIGDEMPKASPTRGGGLSRDGAPPAPYRPAPPPSFSAPPSASAPAPPSEAAQDVGPDPGIAQEASPVVLTQWQKVEFTLTAPGAVMPGVPFELFVWAHESQERSRVLARAREELNVRDLLARTKGPFKISSGTVLSVRLRIVGAVIEEPEDTMVWEGESTSVSFVVTLPELSPETKCYGSAQVYANGIQVAKIPFLLSAMSDEGIVEAPSVRYKTAFASYASDDRDAVLGRIQGIHKIAPELEIFLDVVSLRSGQSWEKELWRVIPASDVFYLFWSTHARASEWVEKEWRCALRERGVEFIDPIPLQSPEESPPPPELSALHFNDWELAFRRTKPAASQ